jgi:hypothetical protein
MSGKTTCAVVLVHDVSQLVLPFLPIGISPILVTHPPELPSRITYRQKLEQHPATDYGDDQRNPICNNVRHCVFPLHVLQFSPVRTFPQIRHQ